MPQVAQVHRVHREIFIGRVLPTGLAIVYPPRRRILRFRQDRYRRQSRNILTCFAQILRKTA